MIDLILRYHGAFSIDKEEPIVIPVNTPVNPFKVTLRDPTKLPPVVSRPHYDPSKYQRANICLDALEAAGVARPAPRGTPAYSAAHLVHQKGKDRLCADARGVNAATIRDPSYADAIERSMHTLLHGMQGRNLFSKMDLHLAFTGVPVDIDSIPLMTIMTHRGPYHILRCTFGASDVPAAFQHEYRRVFDEADADSLDQSTSLFVDDSLTGATIGGPNGSIIDAGLDNHLKFHDKVFTALIARG